MVSCVSRAPCFFRKQQGGCRAHVYTEGEESTNGFIDESPVLSLENEEEAYRFFEDVCTVAEFKSMAQRLEVAVLLRQGVTYQEIVSAPVLPLQPQPCQPCTIIWGEGCPPCTEPIGAGAELLQDPTAE